MNNVKFFYCHEDDTIAKFNPSELGEGVEHRLCYVYDTAGNISILFSEVSPTDEDNEDIRLLDIMLGSDSVTGHINDDRNTGAVIVDDIVELDVDGMDRSMSVKVYVVELIEEDMEAESLDVDNITDPADDMELDDDEEYNDIDLEEIDDDEEPYGDEYDD